MRSKRRLSSLSLGGLERKSKCARDNQNTVSPEVLRECVPGGPQSLSRQRLRDLGPKIVQKSTYKDARTVAKKTAAVETSDRATVAGDVALLLLKKKGKLNSMEAQKREPQASIAQQLPKRARRQKGKGSRKINEVKASMETLAQVETVNETAMPQSVKTQELDREAINSARECETDDLVPWRRKRYKEDASIKAEQNMPLCEDEKKYMEVVATDAQRASFPSTWDEKKEASSIVNTATTKSATTTAIPTATVTATAKVCASALEGGHDPVGAVDSQILPVDALSTCAFLTNVTGQGVDLHTITRELALGVSEYLAKNANSECISCSHNPSGYRMVEGIKQALYQTILEQRSRVPSGGSTEDSSQDATSPLLAFTEPNLHVDSNVPEDETPTEPLFSPATVSPQSQPDNDLDIVPDDETPTEPIIYMEELYDYEDIHVPEVPHAAQLVPFRTPSTHERIYRDTVAKCTADALKDKDLEIPSPKSGTPEQRLSTPSSTPSSTLSTLSTAPRSSSGWFFARNLMNKLLFR